ncbi:MAG: DNA translocase FtsK [Acidobacteriota bacterium]
MQRRLRVGFSRAARLIDMMEMEGVVSPAAGGKREVLVDQSYFEEVDAQLR